MSPSSSRLIVRSGPNPGMVFDLTKEVTLLGRDVACDIVLGDPEVSRQHSRLTRTPGGYVLEDLGSTNGTFINGERLVAPRVLNNGDLIGMSEKVTLSFDMPSATEGAQTVMSTAAPTEAPIPGFPEPEQLPYGLPQASADAPAPHVPLPVQEEEEPKKRPLWLFAGCGCLLIIAVLIGFLIYMDANYPEILWGPFVPILRMFGF